MKLKDVLAGIDYEMLVGEEELDIKEIKYNSREVSDGDIFFCITGFKTDGHNYADAAVESGAKVIVCEKDIELKNSAAMIKVSRKTIVFLPIKIRRYCI